MRRATSRSCSRSLCSAALSLALTLAGAARADLGWDVLYEQDGVTVSEWPVRGRDLPDFRGEVELEADVFDVLAVIIDVPAQTQWMWQCRESRVLAVESDSAKHVYQVLDLYWPAADRDVVLRSEVQVLGSRELAVRFVSRDDPAAPPVPDLVRMPHLAGEFLLGARDATHTSVTYTVSADPGGSLPALVVRRTVRDSPFQTLVGLRRRVTETRGAYRDVAEHWRSRASLAR